MKTKTNLIMLCIVMVLAILVVPASAADVRENWDNHCASCHGADGKADTKVGKKLKIRDYTKAASLAEEDNAYLVGAIQDGVRGPDGKQRMKPFRETLSEAEVGELVVLIRSFVKVDKAE